MRIDFGQLRDTWENLHGAIRACLLLLLLGAIALVAARPASNLVKQFAAARNLRLAEESMREGAPLEARTRAMSVLQLFPERIEAARLLVAANAAASASDPAPVAEFLLSHKSATPADRELAFQILATTTPLAKTGRIWASLSEEDRRRPANIVSFGNRLLTEGKPDQATVLLRDIEIEDPPDELAAFIVELLTHVTAKDSSRDAKAWSEIQRRLQLRSKKARDRGEELPEWCIAGWESVPTAALGSEAGLAALPEKGSVRLEMTRLRMKLQGAPVDPASPPVVGWLADKTPEQRLPLAKLLHDGGVPEAAFTLFDTEQALSIAEYEWLRLKRIARAEWAAWKSTLTGSSVTGIPQLLIQADLAVAYELLGQPEESSAAWKEAMRIAESRPAAITLCDLSRRVRKWMPNPSHEAILRAIQLKGEPLPLYSDLTELMVSLEHSGRDRDLLQLLYVYRSIEPAEPVSATRLAYLALLCGDLTPARAIEMIQPVVAIAPDAAHPRLVAVIAKLLEGDHAGAVEWLGDGKVDWTQTPPLARWLADVARSGATTPPGQAPESEELMPCERALVKQLLRKTGE
jgi:tetratricopeptide (TPR) repeat protein